MSTYSISLVRIDQGHQRHDIKPPSLPTVEQRPPGTLSMLGTAKGPVKETAVPRELQVFDQPPAGQAGSWPVSIVLLVFLLSLFDLI